MRLLSLTGISVVVAMLVLTIWMARTVDQIALEFYQKMVANAIDDEVNDLSLLTGKDTHNGFGLRWVVTGDSDAVAQNIGTTTTQAEHFDLSYIFGADDQLLYAFEAGGIQSDLGLERSEVTQALLDRVRAAPLTPHEVFTAFVPLDGELAAVAAARFTPVNTNAAQFGEVPVLMNVVIFDDYVLEHLANHLFLPDLTVSFKGSSLPSSVHVPLINGSDSATIAWSDPEVGQVLMIRSFGALAVVCLLTGLGHIVVGRITMRLARAYTRKSHEARNDSLTGLLNRSGFEDALDSQAVADALELNRLAVVVLDMDGFKGINDTYGHAIGDIALQAMSYRLQSIVRRNDIVARLGGDEFIIIVIDDNPKAIVALLTGRIAEAGRKPVELVEGVTALVQASMGHAVSKDGQDMRSLMMAADHAMYDAKTAKAFLNDAQRGDTPTNSVETGKAMTPSVKASA